MRILILVLSLSLLGLSFATNTGCSRPAVGQIVHLSEMELPEGGRTLLLSRYSGLMNGWDVSLFCRLSADGQWFGYYLAHESDSWHDSSIKLDEQLVVINRGDEDVAHLDLSTLSFLHLLQDHVYSKKDGIEGGREAPKWGLE